MYIIKDIDDNFILASNMAELNQWAEDKWDVDNDAPEKSYDGCVYMEFDFKPTGRIKVQEATPRRFKLIKKSK